jgi:hypothetical protein
MKEKPHHDRIARPVWRMLSIVSSSHGCAGAGVR